jgi:hypothetical protein
MNIEEQRKARFQFLNRLYEATGGDEYSYVDMFELGKEIGLDGQETQRVFQYLSHEGLLAARALGGAIGITHFGVVNVEQALSQPSKPTQYFPPVNIINIQSMVNSSIQQASPGATQTATYNSSDLKGLGTILDELTNSLSGLKLSEQSNAELRADITAINAQLVSPNPKGVIIKEAGKSIRNILEGTTGSLIAAGLATKLKLFGI